MANRCWRVVGGLAMVSSGCSGTINVVEEMKGLNVSLVPTMGLGGAEGLGEGSSL